mgnify:CR=1 FL=1
MSQVWERQDLGPYERLVMLCLADHADDEGVCYPSVARLVDRTGMGERGVQRVLRRLADDGHVAIEPNAGRKGTNVYRITPAPDAPPRTRCTPHPVHPNTPAPDAPPHDVHPAPDAPNPRTPCGGTPAPGAPEPSLNHQEPSEELLGRKRRRPEVPLPDDWVPSDRNLADAASRGFSKQEIDREAHQFRDHHLARDTRFRDWDAAWRTWLGNARRFADGRMARPAVAGGGGRGRSLASIAAQRRAADAH